MSLALSLALVSSAAASSPASSELAPSPESVRAALDEGELGSARDQAVALSASEPSPDHFELEAEVWLTLADYKRATQALEAGRDSLPIGDPERAAFNVELRRIAELSRGRVADEPESTQRESIDAERAARLAALRPALAGPTHQDEPKPRASIVTKWYFWVTLGVIAGTAGAIVGLVLASSLEQQNSQTGAARLPSGPSRAPARGLVLRF